MPTTLPARLAIALAFALLALPVLVVEIPPLCDYVNHYVRIWLLAGGAAEPPLSAMYAPAWESARTNIGMDYIAVLLGQLLPIGLVGSLCVLLAVLLGPVGALALQRSWLGRASAWQVAIAGLAWNATLMAGFVNFHIGLGLALLAAAAEPQLARSSALLAILIRFALAALILKVHVFGFLLYVVLLAGLGLGRTWPGPGLRPALVALRHAITRSLAPALALVPLVLFAPALPGAHVAASEAGPVWFWTVQHKANVFLAAVATYAIPFDLVFAAAVVATALWLALARTIETHAGLLVAAIGLGLLAIVAPNALAGTWWIDGRLPIMAALVAMAALAPSAAIEARRGPLLAGLFLALVSARTAIVASAWRSGAEDIAAVRRAVASVPAGARLLPVDHGGAGLEPTRYPWGRYFYLRQPAHWYYPVLAIKWQRAFVPSLYWAAGKQPIRVLPPYDRISFPELDIASSDKLVRPDRETAYLAEWRTRYDFVLLLNADVGRGIDLATLPELQLAANEGFARLYRILR